MENIIEYLYDAKNAFQNYSLKEYKDEKILQTMYDYITRIEDLTPAEKDELNLFISDNTFDDIHLATLYTSKERKGILRNQLKRMTPYKIGKPAGKIYQLKGNITPLLSDNSKKEMHVKVYKRKYRKKQSKNAN